MEAHGVCSTGSHSCWAGYGHGYCEHTELVCVCVCVCVPPLNQSQRGPGNLMPRSVRPTHLEPPSNLRVYSKDGFISNSGGADGMHCWAMGTGEAVIGCCCPRAELPVVLLAAFLGGVLCSASPDVLPSDTAVAGILPQRECIGRAKRGQWSARVDPQSIMRGRASYGLRPFTIVARCQLLGCVMARHTRPRYARPHAPCPLWLRHNMRPHLRCLCTTPCLLKN